MTLAFTIPPVPLDLGFAPKVLKLAADICGYPRFKIIPRYTSITPTPTHPPTMTNISKPMSYSILINSKARLS